MNIDHNTTIKEFYESIRTDFLPTMIEEGVGVSKAYVTKETAGGWFSRFVVIVSK